MGRTISAPQGRRPTKRAKDTSTGMKNFMRERENNRTEQQNQQG